MLPAICTALVVSSATVSTSTEPGGRTISRADAVRLASTDNPQVAETGAKIDRAKARQEQVRAARFPALSLQAFIATSEKAQLADEHGVRSTKSAYDFSFNDLSAAFGGVLDLLQPLYTFGKIDLRAEATEHDLEASKAQVEMTRQRVALEAASLYEASLYALALERFMEDVIGTVERSIQDTDDRLNAGAADVSEEDVLRLKAALGLARLVKNAADAGLEQTDAGLHAYLDLDPEVPIALADTELDPIPHRDVTLEALVALARENRPELRALREGITGYERLADAEAAAYFPDFFLLGFVSGAYTPGREWANSRYAVDPLGHLVPGALVGARWELKWDTAGARAAEVRSDATKLRNRLAWAERGIPAEVEKLYRDRIRYERDAAQLAETVPVTKRWTVRATADYSAGLGGSREVTDAVDAYVVARSKQFETTYRFNVTMAKLARATGTLRPGNGELYPGREAE